MIPNIWSKIKLVCANPKHEEPIRMAPHKPPEGSVARSLYGGSLQLFYSCPLYYPENRKNGEMICRNHISINEYENAVKRVSDEIEKAMESGGDVNLQGFKWKSRQGIEYKVIKHREDEIIISCLNKKAIKGL